MFKLKGYVVSELHLRAIISYYSTIELDWSCHVPGSPCYKCNRYLQILFVTWPTKTIAPSPNSML